MDELSERLKKLDFPILLALKAHTERLAKSRCRIVRRLAIEHLEQINAELSNRNGRGETIEAS